MLSLMGRAPPSFKVCSRFFLTQKGEVYFFVSLVETLFGNESHPDCFVYQLFLPSADPPTVM